MQIDDLIKKLTSDLHNESDLYKWLQLFSILLWNKIGFIRSIKGLKIHETTITQDLIYQFWLMAQKTQVPIQLFESRDEKTNGADIEICVETKLGYLTFPCQSKIIKEDSKYHTLKHKSSKTAKKEQIELLVKYANDKGGIPIYFLYNFFSDLNECQKIEKITKFEIDNYGCSVVLAKYIQDNFFNKGLIKKSKKTKWIIPSFTDLHPKPALPIHIFFERINKGTVEKNLVFPDKTIKKLKFYSKDELISDNFWTPMNSQNQGIGFVISDAKGKKAVKYEENNDEKNFRPKFKILFPLKKESLGIYVLS